MRRSFTLVELLMVIAILSILAGMVFMAAWGVQEDARVARTKAQVEKLHELLMYRWESYRTRPVPLQIPPNTSPEQAARLRLDALRDLMRMELPDRQSDVLQGPVALLQPPTAWRAYQRRAQRTLESQGRTFPGDWSPEFQGAECLYLIVATMRDGGTSALDFFRPHEIGDVDGDGMPEILDAWGRPIEFLRWAPGFISEVQVPDRDAAPDYFDVVKSDPRWRNDELANFNLYPLIFSAGRDGEYGVRLDVDRNPRHDPYSTPLLGEVLEPGAQDNITNHALIIQ